MADLILTPKEATVLSILTTRPTFTPAQLSMWTRMTPSEVHEVVDGLTQRQFVIRVEGDTLKLTDDGMAAVRQVTRKDEKTFWVSAQAESFSSSGLDDALDGWIEKL